MSIFTTVSSSIMLILSMILLTTRPVASSYPCLDRDRSLSCWNEKSLALKKDEDEPALMLVQTRAMLMNRTQGRRAGPPHEHRRASVAAVVRPLRPLYGETQLESQLKASIAGGLQENVSRPQRVMKPLRPGATAAEVTGVAANSVGDLKIFLYGIGIDLALCLGCVIGFSYLRRVYPQVYQSNIEDMTAPRPSPDDTFFGWVRASWKVKLDDVVEARGLDQAMLLEFMHLVMKIMGFLGLPMIFLVGPLHCFFGGNAAGADTLSKWGMANVVTGSPLFYLHAAIVWATVVLVQYLIFRVQRRFMKRRRLWLMALPSPRATTILVEGIPEKNCSDSNLRDFFERIFGKNSVQDAFVMKNTKDLCVLISTRQAYQLSLAEAEFQLTTTGTRPMFVGIGGWQDTIEYYEERLKEVAKLIQQERERIEMLASEEHFAIMAKTQQLEDNSEEDEPDIVPLYEQTLRKIHSTSGFVTFVERKDAEMALCCRLTSNDEEYVVSMPPDPSDVIYEDLQKDSFRSQVDLFIGYGVILTLFVGFMPFVIGISTITRMELLEERIPAFGLIIRDYPDVATMWDAVVGSVALNFFMSFLPAFLTIIFYKFVILKAEAWLQHRVQQWYFYFLIIYVLLVTAIGTSLTGTARKIAARPLSAFEVLAESLPYASHFYLSYLPMTWVTHCVNLTRANNLLKFLFFRTVLAEDAAKERAEPEDQNFYGIGARSARHVLMAVICLTFSTLSPLICALGFINAFICRIIYGFLVNYSESRKPDLGGVFWCTQLHHLQQGMFLYIMLMTGVLLERASHPLPGCIAGSCLVFMAISYRRFQTFFQWDHLPLEHTAADDGDVMKKQTSTRQSYQQPELIS
mmetsp:Transcript_31269/g.68508  ORF Transcript_31269/g.68508 Transcript_31269/m.68508 type:complete len:859 (-) Transcript_31269:347-2923(-)|eukprot:CAMPEP_0170610214 /NCGR_PEP_ID=MMETSP0224-20130122/22534_1 /TAXON_ID=285029 /ORGANISM="Togula jolla, Strain CCCM 725" /LENGTH=858 /DNA_ID=CAMNT_0010935563 /DNA_START=57 /DNA_END=2633 /DNA_ORIENTATION=-